MRRMRIDDAQRLRLKLMFSLAVVLATLIFFDIKMRPIVDTFSEYQAKTLATRIINEAVVAELENSQIQYADIVNVSTDADGMVTAMETNTVTINILKSRLTTNILDGLSDITETEVKIHIGTLLGSQIFVGRGPTVPFRIAPASEIVTQFTHSFDDAGINQTRHRIVLEVNVSVTAMVAGHSSRVEVPCNFIIVDNIIVGKVPDSFTEVTGDESPIISKINDYANN